MDHVVGFGVKGISKTIAITSEAIAGRRCKQSPAPEGSETNYTVREWELDELSAEQASARETEHSDRAERTANEVSDAFIQSHNSALHSILEASTRGPIPKPVILPQRRPRDRSRGFVQAYAPVLGECSGIDQDTFIGFINDWDKASKASPVFDVINIACFGVGMVPNVVSNLPIDVSLGSLTLYYICMAVSASVGTANRIAQEIQIRYRSNSYLDRINEELFKPRGLFAMVMAYKPEMSDELVLRADTTDPTSLALSKALDDSSKAKKVLRRLRMSRGVSQGDIQVPEGAPLIYPSLDLALTSQALTQSTMKHNAAVINDYLDRRAQVDFSTSDPNSKLAKALPPQQKQFVNRFCDPDHPVNSGSIFGLLTGGTFDPISMGRVQRAEVKAKRKGEPPLTDKEKHDAYMGRKVRGRVTGTPSKTLPVIGKMLKKDVLYLVIVNLPTEAEVEELGQALSSS